MTTPDAQYQPPAKKRGGCMKWGLIIIGVLILVGMCSALVSGNDEDTEPATQEATTQTTPQATTEQTTPAVDKAAQRDELTSSLDSWFDGCDWEHQDSEHTARASCAENELGVIVGNTSTDVKVVLDGIAESADGGPGGYAVKDNWAVWSTDQDNVNRASDVLSASSGRESF